MVSTFDEPFLLMNTDYKMNPLYYGDAYLTGLVTVSYNKIYNFNGFIPFSFLAIYLQIKSSVKHFLNNL